MTGRVALGGLGIILSLSVLSMGWRWHHRVPEASLDAAAAQVRAAWQAGDLLVSVPAHQVGPRVRLGDLTLLEGAPVLEHELEGYQRAHLLTLDALGSSEQPAAALLRRGSLVATHRWPGVTLQTFALAPTAPIHFDLYRDIAQVRVTARYADGEVAPCDRMESHRWRCPRHGHWSYVGREIFEVQGRPRACVWLHPLAAGEELRVSLPAEAAVPAGEVFMEMGFTAYAAGAAKAPVRVEVRAANQVVSAVEHPVREAWGTQRVTLPAQPSPPLELVITSRNNGAAHFCARVQVRGSAPPGAAPGVAPGVASP